MPRKAHHLGVQQVHLGSDYTQEELEWIRAIEALRRRVRFPTCREILQEALRLGYRKVAPPLADGEQVQTSAPGA